MEKSFDLGSVLRKHQKKHKIRPTQFESVAGGVHRRLENSLRQRKSSRLTSFDCARNLPQPSPLPENAAKQKADGRKKQLQKWKEEKEKKKKELASKKIKPFLTGVPHNPLKYVPPPPIRPVPSSSGCVTRSQSARNQKEGTKKMLSQSFAPSNARFHAPQIKTLTKLPKLEPIKKNKEVPKFNFQPFAPVNISTMSTRSRVHQKIPESRLNIDKAKEVKPKTKIVKPVSKPYLKSKVVQSSSISEKKSHRHTSASSSDIDLTARIMSSSEDSNNHSSTDDSTKALQSSSSCEFVPEKQSPMSRRITRQTSLTKTVTPRKSIPGSNNDKSKFNTPRNSVPKSESSSEEKLRSPKSPVDVPMTPEQIAEEFKNISPCVTMSRGKENARKEMKKKIEEGLLDEDASDMDSIEHFQRQLASEIKRMTEICEVWDKIYEQVSLPESVQGLVLGAVGQARLLMSQKMQQFAQLVQRCARPEPGATLVTPADLRGFWDMVFLQVENLDMRFKELEELKARDWVEIVAPVPAAGRAKRAARPAPAPAPARARGGAPAGATSRLRDMIAAARKAKVQEAQAKTPPPAEERTFEAGFFSVRSPARSPRSPATPRDKQNLLKAVLSSEAEKASASKKSASFAMLRASVLGKSVEYEGIAPLPQTPLPQINFQATPGRSILKQPQENMNKSSIKQIKVVLFDQSDTDMNTSGEDLNLSNKQDVEFKNKEKVNFDSAEHIKAVSALSPMDMDEKELKQTGKEKSKRNSKLIRQDPVTTEIAPITTRRMQKHIETLQTEQETPLLEQKSLQSEKKTPKRSARKKLQAEETMHTEQEIPQAKEKSPQPDKKTSRRSIRKKVLAEVDDMQTPQMEQDVSQTEQKSPQPEKKTPRRSTRFKVLAEVEDTQIPQTEQVSLEQKTSRLEKKTPKRLSQKKVLTEIESNVLKENVTPVRSTRRKKTEVM